MKSLSKLRVLTARLAMICVMGISMSIPNLARAEGVRYRDNVFSVVKSTKNIAYGAAINNFGELQTLLLDLYEPDGDVASGRPVVIWVHGGGFKTGSRSSGRDTATEFAQRGYVAASIDYRLRPTGTPDSSSNQDLIIDSITGGEPTQISDARHDLQAAIRWFRANATPLRIDSTRISVGGASAGAVMALGANFRSDEPGDSGNPGYDSSIASAMSISGAWLGQDIGVGEKPIVMFHGTNDTTVPFALAANTCATQTALTNVCEPHIYPGEGHGVPDHKDEMQLLMVDFLCRYVTEC